MRIQQLPPTTPPKAPAPPPPPQEKKDTIHIGGKDLPVTPASLGTKLALGVCAASAAWSVGNIVTQVLSQPTLPQAALAGGLSLASVAASWVLSDLGSGFIHHGLDNYGKPGPSVIGKLSALSQAHHYYAQSCEQTTWAGELDPVAKGIAPLALGLAALNPHYFVQAGAMTALGAILFSQTNHRLTHQPKPSPLVETLRNLKVIQTKDDHHAHHRAPWIANYCFVNGVFNGVLEKTQFWRKYEKAVYEVTGVEPRCWQHPAVRDLALGKIDQATYESRFKDEMPLFRKNLNVDGEREQAREFLHGRFEP